MSSKIGPLSRLSRDLREQKNYSKAGISANEQSAELCASLPKNPSMLSRCKQYGYRTTGHNPDKINL